MFLNSKFSQIAKLNHNREMKYPHEDSKELNVDNDKISYLGLEFINNDIANKNKCWR